MNEEGRPQGEATPDVGADPQPSGPHGSNHLSFARAAPLARANPLALLCQTHSRAGSRTRNAHRGQVAMRAIVARIALRTSGSDGVEKGPFFFFAPERL